MNAGDYVTVEKVRSGLKALYHADPETNLQAALLRCLADDLRPVDEKGRWKPSPLLVLIMAIVSAFLGVFAFFSIGGHR
jgi:hypothetical protein